ncbi:MAG: sulfotransferase family protein [Syntrophothermus sp.]
MKRRKNFNFPVMTLAGSTLKNIFTQMHSHKIQPKYYPKFVLSLLVSAILGFFNFIEKKRWDKKAKDFKMRSSPVFIIGFWRSGTSLLHHLMCQDEKAGYTTTLQTIFPHLVLTQKKWLRKLMKFLMPDYQTFDQFKQDADLPQEEEYGMVNLVNDSLYKFFLFPGDFEKIISEAISLPEKDKKTIEEWKKIYAHFISKSMLNTGGTRYVGKNPCNMFRIKLIKEIYPDARFVFLHRSPYQVVESLYRFALAVFPDVQLQDVPREYSREKIVLLYREILEAYFHHRNFLHPSDLIEIRMDDFLTDKIGTLKRIYKKFNLHGFEKALPHFEKYLAENPSAGRHFYEVHPETIKLVNEHAASIVRRLGYRLQHVPVTEVVERIPATV